MVEKIHYIPLKTIGRPLGSVANIKYYKGKFYVQDNSLPGIYCFDHNGKFLFLKDDVGKGPGEYIAPITFTIDRFTDELLITCSALKKVLYHDLDGNFKKSISVSGHFSNIYPLSDKYYALYNYTPKGVNYKEHSMYYAVDKNMDIVYHEYQFNRGKHFFKKLNPIYGYNGSHYVSFSLDNTIYGLSKTHELYPAFTIDFGIYNTPQDLIADFGPVTVENIKKSEHDRGISYCSRINNIIENENILSFSFIQGRNKKSLKFKNVIMNKKNGSYFFLDQVKNDIDGIKLISLMGSINDTTVFSIQYAYQIKKELDEGNLETENLPDYLKNINMSDDPVIMIMDMKDING